MRNEGILLTNSTIGSNKNSRYAEPSFNRYLYFDGQEALMYGGSNLEVNFMATLSPRKTVPEEPKIMSRS